MDIKVNEIRDMLQDRRRTQKLVSFSIEKILEKYKAEWGESKNANDRIEILATALNSFYPQAINFVYDCAESEIEKLFVNSFVICFLFGDPLRLKFEPSKEQGFEEIQKTREYLKLMLEIDKQHFEETGETNGWFWYIDFLLETGEISKEQHEFHFYDYIFTHGMNYYNAFYVTLQTRFSEIKIDGKSIRPDMFIWKPSDENYNLVVECDGFQFHSGKNSFISDRKRDRHLRSLGFDVLRFSGSEIYNDPVAMGKELFEYLQKTGPQLPKRT